jgi:hypothetical protein
VIQLRGRVVVAKMTKPNACTLLAGQVRDGPSFGYIMEGSVGNAGALQQKIRRDG